MREVREKRKPDPSEKLAAYIELEPIKLELVGS